MSLQRQPAQGGGEEDSAQSVCSLERQRVPLLSDSSLIPNSHEPQLGYLPWCSEKPLVLPINSSFCLRRFERVLVPWSQKTWINQNAWICTLIHPLLMVKPSESWTASCVLFISRTLDRALTVGAGECGLSLDTIAQVLGEGARAHSKCVEGRGEAWSRVSICGGPHPQGGWGL